MTMRLAGCHLQKCPSNGSSYCEELFLPPRLQLQAVKGRAAARCLP
jgi:hypothetical protein